MNKHVGIDEAQADLSALLDEVERSGEVIIMRHGKPVAKLVATKAALIAPIAPEYSPEEIERRRAALKRIRQAARELDLGDVSHDDIKAWIEEGRG